MAAIAARSPYELAGFTLGSGPAPIGYVFFPVTTGLNVLYGVNGVGKTRVLGALSDVAAGVRLKAESASLHFRVVDTARSDYSGFMSEVVKGAQRQWAVDDADAPDPTKTGYGAYPWEDLVAEAAKESSLDPGDELVSLIIEQGLFSCQPSGSTAAPTWDVLVACQFRAGSQDLVSAALVLAAEAEAASPWASRRAGQWDNLTSEERERAMEAHLELRSQAPLRSAALRLSLRIRTLAGDLDAPAPWVDGEIVPLWPLCTVATAPLRVFSDAVEVSGLAGETLELLLADHPGRPPRSIVSLADASDVEFDDDVTLVAQRLAVAATSNARAVVPNIPRLEFALGHPERWLRGVLPHWVGWDEATDQPVPVTDLGTAHTRWAALGIALALRADVRAVDQAPFLVLCDEPEQGLHRGAEAWMGKGLARLAYDLGACVVAASHSPAVLTEPLVNLLQVQRSPVNGDVVVAPLQVSLGSRMATTTAESDLGLPRSDLLQLVRVAVVVEGLHDEVILRALLGRELDASGAWLMPMRGAKELRHLADAQLLFDFTSAAVLVVVDNVAGAEALPIWAEAQRRAEAGERAAAQNALARLGKLQGWEADWLRELGDRALATGQLDRVRIFPLGQPDVVCYLPVQSLVAADDWEEVLVRWRGQPRSDKRNLKDWLADEYGRPIGRKLIAAAVDRMTDVPEELQALGHLIMELGAFRGSPLKGTTGL